MAEYSKQGINIAFIGTRHEAQVACAEYLRKTYNFKRLNMEKPLDRFLRTAYWYKVKQNANWGKKIDFYDAIYKVDPEIFIKYSMGVMKISEADTVIWNVRYINEMKALQDIGFKICRINIPNRRVQINKYSRKAATGSVPVALQFDSNFSINHNTDYSVTWSKMNDTGPIMESFLERIGYKFDL